MTSKHRVVVGERLGRLHPVVQQEGPPGRPRATANLAGAADPLGPANGAQVGGERGLVAPARGIRAE
ncbi:hypothetical protein RM844_05580 [Streptomyces sp. DSM 44915]|uniref:Uncharacterized protein n=1 Tax=Streptomyces chisholmiae TaxID=3075540 RepID=A0ABU2JLC3_9ACTN|nr:hypothetical protein [Streptomyces sp. DSM 44915]MDT0265760.1 hypothetical protein [Streptomyces sp. DSM 44915]